MGVPGLLLLLLVSTVRGHVETRYRGTRNMRISSTLAEPQSYYDSTAGCVRACMKNSLCTVFQTTRTNPSAYKENGGTFDGYKCRLGMAGYSSSPVSSIATDTLWEPHTTDQAPRSKETVPAATSPEECPVVHRMWPSDNSTLGVFTISSSGEGEESDGLTSIFDNDVTTKFTSAEVTFPWLQIDLGRKYRISKVSLLSGSKMLMNVDVRVGDTDLSGTANTRMTSNTRCGIYYGPTLIDEQWVEVDCGYTWGLMGRYLTLQHTERYKETEALQLKEVEVHGWGRVCGTEDPDF